MGHKMNRWTSEMLASTALVLCLAIPASAQAPAPAKDDNDRQPLEEIVITSTKRAENVQDVPLSISVLDDKTIEKSGATNFRDLLQLAPSIVFSQSQSPGQSNVGIRGISTAGGSAGLEPSVGIYVDGVFTDRTAIGIGDFNDIQRVEILRGPQGTLFGKGSPAGIINFITKQPEFEFGGGANLTMGNYNLTQFAATMTGPVMKDKVAARVSIFKNERGPFLDNVIGQDRNDLDSKGLRSKLLFTPSDNFDATFSYERGETFQYCCAPVIDPIDPASIAAAAARGRPFTQLNQAKTQTVAIDGNQQYEHVINAYGLIANLGVGDHTVTSVSSYRTWDQKSFIDADFSQLNALNFIEGNRDHKQFSQELRVASPASQKLTYILGLYYYDKEVAERGGSRFDPPVSFVLGARNISGSDIKNKAYAAFGQTTYQVTEKADVTLGLRYSYDDKDLNTFERRFNAAGVQTRQTGAIESGGAGDWSGTLNGRYFVTDDVMTYASFTRGYKAFGFNDDPNLDVALARVPRFFDSERSDNYEIGMKSEWPRMNAVLNITGFVTKYTDFQSLSLTADNRFVLQNAASLTSQGIEADVVYQPIDALTLQAAVAYLDAEYDSYPNAQGVGGVLIDLSGKPLRDAPKWSASLIGEYRVPVPATAMEAFVRGEYFYRSATFTTENLDPLLRQEAYAKINARVGIADADGVWSFEIWGKNLTDKTTFGRGSSPLFVIIPAGTSRIKFLDDPRTYGATLRFKF